MPVEIVEFEDRHATAFKALNEAWIAKHFTVEAKDSEVLDDPRGKIIGKGGRIFMAMADERPVGCVALIPMTDGGFEVAKMTVAETARGLGLGARLMQRCIETGKAAGAPRLFLETKSRLAPARALYLAAGFVDMPPEPSEYARCDTWMELRL
jgi:putative acetyltransferase